MDDLKTPTVHINLVLQLPFTAEAPHKITKEESNFNAAKTLHDAKFHARHEGQHRLCSTKVITL